MKAPEENLNNYALIVILVTNNSLGVCSSFF